MTAGANRDTAAAGPHVSISVTAIVDDGGASIRSPASRSMNSLGRRRDACILVLRAYVADVRRLAASITTASGPSEPHALTLQLDRLAFQLEVDVDARSGAAGSERMTEVEATLLLPALVRAQSDIAALGTTTRSEAWLTGLTAAQSSLSAAIARLRSWHYEAA